MNVIYIGDITDEEYMRISTELRCLEEDDGMTEVVIELSSGGGNVPAAFALYDRLKSSRLEVTVVVFGHAESAGVLILAAGDTRIMMPNSFVMVHEEGGKISGSLREMESELGHMRAQEDRWNGIMAQSSTVSAGIWEQYNQETSYLSAEDCLEIKLIHRIGRFR